ncbi:MAG: endonuclease domain-containing protein [Actinomycetales bacterium]
MDLLASLPWPQARRLWAWTVTRNVLGPEQLAEAAATRVGWRGTPQLKRLVRSTSSGALSEAEERLHALLRKGRLERWVANAPVRVGGRVVAVADVLFPDARLVIEVDGYTSHTGVNAFHQDRARQNALVLAGYTVLRFTWRDLTRRPDDVLREIERALRPRTAQ